VQEGDELRAKELSIRVLHPPAVGPEGNENARSLVLLVQHAGHSILLTGDLEGAGLAHLVYELPPQLVDIMLAPHHGSPRSNTPDLVKWARPRVVVSSQTSRSSMERVAQMYQEAGVSFLPTSREGAVTIRSNPTGLVVETFRSPEPFVVPTQAH
jgi:competence protein ComEC